MEHILFSDSIQMQHPKRPTSDGVRSAGKGSFNPSNSDSDESDDETETNLFSIASKFPTDSNLPASCLVNDEEFEDDNLPLGSVDFKEE